MKMQRKKLVKVGYVNFPFDHPEYKNSGEGGMVVKLVVCGKKPLDGAYGESWSYGVCCGAGVTEVMAENLVGDDKRPSPKEPLGKPRTYRQIVKSQKDWEKWTEYHFPGLFDNEPAREYRRNLSVGYAAVILMGSTGWSGYSDKNGSWVCKYSDLTADGKKLYNMVKKMYPKQELHLLTYLDT